MSVQRGDGPAAAPERDDERFRALEAAFHARVRLESLVGSIAAELLVADPAEIHRQIETGLGRLAGEMGADRAYLLRTTGRFGDSNFLEWAAPGFERPGDDELPDEAEAWWAGALRSLAVLRVDSLDDLQGEGADAVRAVLALQGVQSFLVVPLPLRPRHAGFVGMVAVAEPRRFDDEVVGLLRVAGEVLVSALERFDAATALAAATAELEQRNVELERSNEELERFAHAAAHDLRAPLARIEMAVASLGARVAGDETAAGLVDVAARGAAGLRGLIEDLLAYAATGDGLGRPGPVDLDEVAATVLHDLQPAIADAGAEVVAEPLGQASGHATLLRQLLQNLVVNALTFRRPEVTPVVRIEAEQAGDDGLILSVRDNGIGIPLAQRTAVFTMFTRLHPRDRFPGSGIGLATCQKVVAHLGGRIWVDDGLDGGTAVRAWLPLP